MMKISITHQVQGQEENIKIENIISDNVTIEFGSESVSLRNLLDIYNHASHSNFDDVRELLELTDKQTIKAQTLLILDNHKIEGKFNECYTAMHVYRILFPDSPRGISAPELPPANKSYTNENLKTMRYIYLSVITKWYNENLRWG